MPWDRESVDQRLPGRTVLYFPVLDSTMREVEQHPEGTLVVAGAQTAGIGRHGHTWESERDAGLYFSVSLPLTPLLTLALGIAAVEAIRTATHVVCDLRWPNDVLLHERKLAGILVQSAQRAAVAGIGINILQRSFPPELSGIATSLALETGLEFRPEDIFVELVLSMEFWRVQPAARIREEFAARSSYSNGKRVQVPIEGQMTAATTAGITPEGFLQVLTADGRRQVIMAGGVRPA
jgi:BirA family transcriptional regulator, biotin operon repressor / biotin---[acetyl-CoA-carboxylase] ligase